MGLSRRCDVSSGPRRDRPPPKTLADILRQVNETTPNTDQGSPATSNPAVTEPGPPTTL